MEKSIILKNLKGGSFSSTNVVKLSNDDIRVRKYISRTYEREYGLVRWQSQIRRMQHLHLVLPVNSPQIQNMGVNNDYFYYDIPYYKDALNLFDYLSTTSPKNASNLFEEVNKLIQCYSSISYGSVKGSFSVFLSEEVNQRLFNAKKTILDAHKLSTITKSETEHTLHKIDLIEKKLCNFVNTAKNINISESLTHGNLTLENMLYIESEKRVIIIDPYGETYCDSVLGDYSQLMQSSLSLYELIVSKGESNIESLITTNTFNSNIGLKHFGNALVQELSKLDEEKQIILNLFHAAQFIRMFPFKITKTPRLAIYFLLHGIKLIQETLINA